MVTQAEYEDGELHLLLHMALKDYLTKCYGKYHCENFISSHITGTSGLRDEIVKQVEQDIRRLGYLPR